MACRVTTNIIRDNVVLGGQVLDGDFSYMCHGQAASLQLE